MDWKIQIQNELDHARLALTDGNDGKARACSRRAVGIMLKQLEQKNKTGVRTLSAVDRLKEIASDETLPENIRKAAQRLVTNVNRRLTENFTLHPLNDVKILIDYFSESIEP